MAVRSARRVGAAAARADGLTVAYVMAVVNASLACVAAFGVAITVDQAVAVIAVANATVAAVLHWGRKENGRSGR